jgi:hypothetical protein
LNILEIKKSPLPFSSVINLAVKCCHLGLKKNTVGEMILAIQVKDAETNSEGEKNRS